jgi:hypothetical protein
MNRFESELLISRLARKGLEATLSLWELLSGANLTYIARPKFSLDANIWSDPRPDLPPFALVMQGPVRREQDFTLETLKLYKRTFPDARLILSTWKSEDPDYLSKFAKEDVEIVTSSPPANAGVANVNYQLATSHAGLLRAASLGAKYALKCRTDQRLYAINVQAMLMNILRAFPLKKRINGQRERIVGVSLNTFTHRMYGLSDMTVFGQIDDMLLYWGARPSQTSLSSHDGSATWRQAASDRLCEVYIVTEFLMALGRPLRWTLEDSWHAMADHFCIVDAESLDLYWPKYARFNERRRVKYCERRIDTMMSFMDWLKLYTGQVFETTVPEFILDLKTQILESPNHLNAAVRA